MSVMSVRISDELANQLSLLAEATGRTKSYLAGQAIQDFLDREAWQITEIKQAIIEADQQDFISEHEMNTLFKKMGVAVQDKDK
ncbi:MULTISPECIES: CopG family ribbon-helix-helix protein [Yersinia]|uniref:Ribbon-helix-helix protein, CopG family n=1 Tax=Yersinia proxima TaxID=2890316 RepID=A0ABW9F1F7_9GAMM|nr:MULTISPECIES: ribbon-helix-helix protein, CopG family [Yersinia]CNL90924.1 Ribbon-helix-helix protein%2C copG family [Yersinia intermedia]EKN4179186.1 ribbon-helix-helix protein, CopG family [Yersinia enterocolitica]MBX9480993.1 ribbon-helix-helix protein, CopG family [Yersinia enterocolitica]HDV7161611.1 ribbon-helix-helix protein, CopG family [Yersinia enterocolitica]HEB9656837.1 ribbon-helix-helix protein, CopG family [Yersinia enterocolitica]